MKKALLAASLLLVCFGCSPGSKYHGDWQTSVPIGTVLATGTSTFSPDGSLSINLSVSSPLGSATIQDKCTWAMEGEKIKIAITAQNWQVNVANGPMKTVVEGAVNMAKQSIKQSFDSAGAMEANWTGNKTFTIAPGGNTFTFTRKK